MARLDPSKDCRFHCLRHDTNVAAIGIKQKTDVLMELGAVAEFDRFI
jgi:hypothetical protein